MNTSLLDSAPEPDSGYLSPPMTEEGTAEEQFSFESDIESTIFSKRSPRISKYNKPETTGSLDLDMSSSTVYQRRRRSFSDPFPRKVSNIVANQSISLNHAHSCYECIASTVCRGMQTCLSFPTHAFCRCAGCSSTSGSALPIRPIAVVQPLTRPMSVGGYANELGLDNDEVQRQLIIDALANRLRRMADEFDRREYANEPLFNLRDIFGINFMQIIFGRFAGWFGF